jgi:hypothetical protein
MLFFVVSAAIALIVALLAGAIEYVLTRLDKIARQSEREK